MSDGYKYIIIKKGNAELPFIFPAQCVHKMMFQAIRAMTRAEIRLLAPTLSDEALTKAAMSLECVAAGSIILGDIKTSGRSETLSLVSRPSDTARILGFPYTGGIL